MRLRELVLSGFFPAGERISELAAVDALDISRTPVRLALSTLAHEGLLQALPTGGYIVRKFSLNDIYDSIEMRGVLEGTACRFAAERSPGKENTVILRDILKEIDDLIAAEPDSEKRYTEFSRLNAQFHEELIRLAKCPILDRTLEQVFALPFASPSAFVSVYAKRSQDRDIIPHAQYQHHRIVDAIEAGESMRAFSLGTEHARLAAVNFTEMLDNNELLDLMPGSNLLIDSEIPRDSETEESSGSRKKTTRKTSSRKSTVD